MVEVFCLEPPALELGKWSDDYLMQGTLECLFRGVVFGDIQTKTLW